MPPKNVEVAVPWDSMVPPKMDEVAEPNPVTYRLPAMESVAEGEVEPIPTLPFESTMSAVVVLFVVEVEITKSGTLESAAVEVAEMEKTPNGEVEPSPSLPADEVKVEVAKPVPR